MKISDPSELVGKKQKRTPKEKSAELSSNISNEKIQQLELRATEAPKYYNDIATLLALASPSNSKLKANENAILALCRVFTRLLSTGRFRGRSYAEEEMVVQEWLEERFREYTRFLLDNLSHRKSIDSQMALTILMKLVQTEVCCQGHTKWADGLFSSILGVLLQPSAQSDEARAIFIRDYFEKFDDVKINTLLLLP
jgi:U3 small nucleolar RNA-associated protein 19